MILVATLHTEAIAHYADIGVRNKYQYCKKHGYMFLSVPNSLDDTRPPSWSKIKLVRRNLTAYEWIFWTDADSLIMNPGIRLESFLDTDADLVITDDQNGINAGQFFIRDSEASFKFLAEVWNRVEFLHHDWCEQAAMAKVIEEGFPIKVCKLPQRSFNSYPQNYQTGDFLLHFAGPENKVLMQKYKVAQ